MLSLGFMKRPQCIREHLALSRPVFITLSKPALRDSFSLCFPGVARTKVYHNSEHGLVVSNCVDSAHTGKDSRHVVCQWQAQAVVLLDMLTKSEDGVEVPVSAPLFSVLHGHGKVLK